jgi:hypothetical protein
MLGLNILLIFYLFLEAYYFYLHNHTITKVQNLRLKFFVNSPQSSDFLNV